MEISSSASIKSNMQKFVEFFLELKNVIELAKSLGFEYFDKETFNSKVID